jgi:hypothetical protein
MAKSQVLHKQRVVARIFKAASAAKQSIKQYEFLPDGRIIVVPGKPDDAGDDLDKELASFVEAHGNEGCT